METMISRKQTLSGIKLVTLNLLLFLFQTIYATCPIQSPNFTTSVNGNSVTITLSGSGYNSYLCGYGDVTYGTTLKHSYATTGVKTVCVRFSYVDSIHTANSCDTTICKTIGITSLTPFGCPIQSPGFTAAVNGNVVTLTKTGGGYNYSSWNYGDGSSGTSNTHTYTSSGVKTVCAIYQYVDTTNTTRHCDTSICQNITINNLPCTWPNLFTSISDSCTASNHTLYGYSTLNTCYKYQWKVNGVIVGTTRILTYPVTQNGAYAVCLSITDTCTHCDTTICSTRNITCISTPAPCNWSSHNPYVNFWDSCTATNKSLNGYIYFATGSTCYKYQWKVNGVLAGTTRPFTYPITQNGTYNVCIIVTDTCNHCDTTFCSTRTITCIPTTTTCTWLNLFTSISDSCTASNHTLYGYSTLNTCYKYQWKVNGVIVGTTRILTYPVTQNGAYAVCLSITDTCSHCDTTICSTRNITCISTPSPCNWSSHNPYVNFWDSCTATNKSLNGYIYFATGSTCYKYQWKVNGVLAGTTRPFTYPVTQNGTYNVCVIVTDTCNHCDTTFCSTRTITCFNNWTCPIHNPNFTTSVNGNTVTITLAGTDYNYYTCGYGDATYGTQLTHSYTTTGTKTICIKFQYIDSSNTAHHCDTTICKTIGITSTTPFRCPIQSAGFSAVVSGNTVTLTKTGGGYNSYSWTYGDGTSGTGNTHTYTSSGVKQICLRVQYVDSTNTPHHCDTTICQLVTVLSTTPFICPIRDAGFSAVVNGNVVHMTITGSGFNSYSWTYGDGSSGTINEHAYMTSGVKTICLKFQYVDSTNTPHHCDTTICKTITIASTTFTCPIQSPGFTTSVSGSTVTITLAGGGYNSYIIGYGDTTYSTHLTHTYTTTGVKTVCVRFQYADSTNTSHHCDTTICKTVGITAIPPFVCPIQTPGFTVSVSGNTVYLTKTGTGYNSYIWGYGDVTYGLESIHTYTTTGIKTICLKYQYVDSTNTAHHCDTTICKTITIASLCDSNSCVLPGDADHDLTVNNFDIFPIGMSYNRTGLVRPNATTQFVLQPSPDWTTNCYYGYNDKFVDCNGDGKVSNTDASVILQNYIVAPFNHYNHRIANTLDSLPPVFLAFDSIPVFQIGTNCNTTEIVSDINVGSPSHMANNVYGIAFSVDYPASFVSDSCFKIQIDLDANSWFATNEPVLYLFKNIPEFHRVDVGIVRTSGTPRSGNGKIGKIKFVVEDGIFLHGRVSSNKQYTFDVNNVAAIDNNGFRLDMTGLSTTANFVVSGVKNKQVEGLRLFPNPAKDKINISAGEIIEDVSIYDIAGQFIKQVTVNEFESTIDVNDLSEGMYMVTIRSKNAVSITRIIKSY